MLEKLLINRIMHHLYKTDFLNNNQFGFTPQKSTKDAAMAVKQFIEPELERGRVVIMASYIKGAKRRQMPPKSLDLRKTTSEREEP